MTSRKRFLVFPPSSFLVFSSRFSRGENEVYTGEGGEEGKKEGENGQLSKSASLVAVRQIYAAICASNNLAGAMKRVPTKFFSGQAPLRSRARARAMPLIPGHKFPPRFLSRVERAGDTSERREREREKEQQPFEKHGEDGSTFLCLGLS